MALNVDICDFIKVGKNLSRTSVEEECNLTLLKMLEQAVHADLTINAEGGSVKAHRSVLASISPVFRAMFEHQMKEQLTSTMELPEISIQTLKFFLALVYVLPDDTAAMEEFRDSIALHFDELLDACCKFQVERLDPTLADNLSSRLNPDNCWDYLRKSVVMSNFCEAEKCGPHDLCSNYILRNFGKVVESGSLILEMQTDPLNVLIFLKALFKKGGNLRIHHDGTIKYI